MLTLLSNHRFTLIFIALFTLMAITRSNHFGDALNLPDASLAIFFLAGFYLRRLWVFVTLICLAVLSDYLAITVGGVSDFCVTIAYGFLLPTYAALWYGGYWSAKQSSLGLRAAALLIATVAAFNISSGGFYLFSGYFEPSWGEYAQRVIDYFPGYLKSAVIYSATAALLHWVLAPLAELSERNRSKA